MVAQKDFGISSHSCDTKVQTKSRAKGGIAGPRPHAWLPELDTIAQTPLLDQNGILAAADACLSGTLLGFIAAAITNQHMVYAKFKTRQTSYAKARPFD